MSFPISYEIIYSKRKSVAIQIRPDGQVIVRAPYGCPRSFINSFIHQKADWIVHRSFPKAIVMLGFLPCHLAGV